MAGGSLTDIASDVLIEELRRRQESLPKPQCGSTKTKSYNVSIHVLALFLILIISTLACAFPILARRFPKLPIPRNFLFFSKHFGTGVLLATAFVHLLPTAFVSLTDPCLPSFWNQGYPPMAGLIAMTSVFFVVSIEMFFAIKGAGHMHGSDFDMLHAEDDEVRPSLRGGNRKVNRSNSYGMRMEPILVPADDPEASDKNTLHSESSKRYHDDDLAENNEEDKNSDSESDLDFDLEIPSMPDTPATPSAPLNPNRRPLHDRHHSAHMDANPQNPQKQLLQCLLLEAGILFHSIFIGMSLSVSTGPAFIVLLIAISFHQTFEGFALGSRISALIPTLFPASSPRPWLMALAYGTTTPIGQAIGLALHRMYDPASATGLITVGITNSISSGLLLFAGLVELLAEDFLSDRSYDVLRGRRRIEACLAVAGGGVLMALVGAWA